MGFWRELIGPSKEEVWRQLCAELSAEFVSGGMWKADAVQARLGDWTVTLDTYVVSTGKSSITYTRLRAPYVNPSGFNFTIYRAGLFSELGKLLGMQDVQVGHPEFDATFVVKANNEEAVRRLFRSPRLAELMLAQPRFYLTVQDDEGFFGGRYPPSVDALYFQVVGVIREVEILRGLFELFTEALNELNRMSTERLDEFHRLLRDLESPGGTINSDGRILWEGDPPRRQAAAALGRLRDRRALPALVRALDDADGLLRLEAIRALGHLGDRDSLPALIPLLGEETAVGGTMIRTAAAEALRSLKAAGLADCFDRALRGEREVLPTLNGDYRPAFIEALCRALTGGFPFAVRHSALTLAEMGAREALPVLKKRLRSGGQETLVRQALHDAIDALSRQSALPRPAVAPSPKLDDLPVPASAATHDSDVLPRPATGMPGGSDGSDRSDSSLH